MNHFAKIAAQLRSHDLDGVLLTNEANRFYASGFHSAGTDGMALVTPEKFYYFTDSRYTEAARRHIQGADIREVGAGRGYSALLQEAVQRHHIRQQEVRQHLVAHIAKVCCDACHPAQRRGDAVTPAGHRVVARFKDLHRKTAHVLGAAVDVYQFRARRHKAPASQIIQRGRAAVHRHRVIF